MAEVKEKNEDIINVPLKRPIEVDGTLIDSITLDFSNFTAEDILQIDEQLRREGKYFDHIFNQHVLLKITSRAANMKVEDIMRLHGADYLEISAQTRNFFIQW